VRRAPRALEACWTSQPFATLKSEDSNLEHIMPQDCDAEEFVTFNATPTRPRRSRRPPSNYNAAPLAPTDNDRIPAEKL
jgi:hypothetical protein